LRSLEVIGEGRPDAGIALRRTGYEQHARQH
jgi:hypothetical protein